MGSSAVKHFIQIILAVVIMPRRKKPGTPMSEEAKRRLKETGWGSMVYSVLMKVIKSNFIEYPYPSWFMASLNSRLASVMSQNACENTPNFGNYLVLHKGPVNPLPILIELAASWHVLETLVDS